MNLDRASISLLQLYYIIQIALYRVSVQRLNVDSRDYFETKILIL